MRVLRGLDLAYVAFTRVHGDHLKGHLKIRTAKAKYSVTNTNADRLTKGMDGHEVFAELEMSQVWLVDKY